MMWHFNRRNWRMEALEARVRRLEQGDTAVIYAAQLRATADIVELQKVFNLHDHQITVGNEQRSCSEPYRYRVTGRNNG